MHEILHAFSLEEALLNTMGHILSRHREQIRAEDDGRTIAVDTHPLPAPAVPLRALVPTLFLLPRWQTVRWEEG